ncbi:hypothetical protein MTO96_044038 [Rhipicephalus appendiculatus]
MAANSGGFLVPLPQLSPEKGDFEVYVQRFVAFAAANKIDKQTKQQMLLTPIGEAAFIMFRNLLFPKTPVEASYEDVVKTLRNDCTPKRSVVVERYKFYRKTNAQVKASVTVVELKKMAATCNLGAFLEEAIRDRLIVGLPNDAIRCKLLATEDKDLTFEKAYSAALGIEAAQGQNKEVRSNDVTNSACATPTTSTGNESLLHKVNRTFRLKAPMLPVIDVVVPMSARSVRNCLTSALNAGKRDN